MINHPVQNKFHGYTTDQLFKDVKFKLGLALRDAGGGGRAGSDMMARLAPRQAAPFALHL